MNLGFILEEIINEVDLSLFLVDGGVGLEEGRDSERVAELIEALGLCGYLAPLTEGFALWVRIGEDYNSVLQQRFQEVWLESLETATGEPDEIGEFFAENYRGFF